MAQPQYTFANLRDNIVDVTIQTNIGSQVGIFTLLNRVARMVYADVDLRSSKRFAALSSNIFDEIFEYTAPSDLKADGIIDVRPRINRALKSRVMRVTPEYFDRKKSAAELMVAILDDDAGRTLLINLDVNDTKDLVGSFESTTADTGTWVAFNDASNVRVDTVNKKQGGASLAFDLDGSGTNAGLLNNTITAFDADIYVDDGYATYWAYINSITDLTDLRLRVGTNSSNYYEMTETTDIASGSLVGGWNLIRFDFVDKTTVGTVTDTNMGYVACFMNKVSSKSDNGYRFDDLILHTGETHDVLYYSESPWQSTTAAFLLNANATGQFLNADADEFDLFVQKGKEELYETLRDFELSNRAAQKYEQLKRRYQLKNPSERLPMEHMR